MIDVSPFRASRRNLLTTALLLVLATSGASGLPSAVAYETYGFRSTRVAAPTSFEGLDLDAAKRRIDLSGDRPIILFLFKSDQSSTRPTLSALQKLRLDYGGRLLVAAVGPDSPRSMAAAVMGLDLAYPVLSNAKAAELLGMTGAPSFLVLAPGGTALAGRAGTYDWSSAAARRFVDELLAAYPAGARDASPAPAAAPMPTASYLSPVEAAVVAELNLARTDPKAYARYLREYRALIHGGVYEKPGETGVQLQEGTRAVDEAISFLEKRSPVVALEPSRGLSSAARAQAQDQGKSGATGHSGSDGSTPFDRMNRYGKWATTAGENAAYGASDARGIVIQLIVDDGVSSRGHRANIFNDAFKAVGVGVGPHPKYGTVCVQDFAGAYEERK
jgi:uncharacterized protein YkwD